MNLVEKDLKYIWHPCSQMKDYQDLEPIVIKNGKGAYIFDIDGKSYLDAVSSWWVNLFGHSNDRINRAINEQVEKLEHVIFANFTHEPAIQLAEKIVNITPEGLDKVFFSDNGSSAIEVALKMSFQYHQQTGKFKKQRFAALQNAYHGETLGALSVGDLDLYSKVFNPLLLNTLRLESPDCYRCVYCKSRDTCNVECFANLEKDIILHHEELCAVIIEPLIQCAAGMKMYPPVYLKRLRKLCDEYDIHLIADEIAVGFGRTGKMFACEHAGISPDIMCLSKGITAGYLPLALTLTSAKIYDAFYGDYFEHKAFMHSHSYTGNPISCAVANESLLIFETEDIVAKNKILEKYMLKCANTYFSENKNIGEYRQIGMVGAIELVMDKNSKQGFEPQKRIGYEVYKKGLNKGIVIRPLGNVIYFMPPYVVNQHDLDFLYSRTLEAITEVLNQ
ncbi:adenosylmethionine--8-amino-7-oxononanoate transaminase [Desulfosporosinus fructosivorans]|uniref:Adenosylmethionine-8-amino-7-oxononanoate aminotransferase n=1 Tax=Desulfosporosinus fructosivorans TaxID=2018669 RepID=A0A4Z0R5S4_9FIRM|nr:adenosylmethionine--8-amino-7-oxononanoate transaminase [Desulfosporosinus fructosivorans]TGE37347.1 adenosylmethionine--8-amino-7-oxononanoate transaminase [Desulfosporosinus fructosivorans]